MTEESVATSLAEEIKKATSSACRMLALREHSKKQIRDKLAKKGFAEQTIKSTLAYLIEENWLCENRFCSAFIRSKSNKGQGLLRIEMDLRQQNISQSCIDQALIEEPIDWQKVCEQTLLKKLRTIQVTDNALIMQDFKQKAKLEKFLNYRGFSSDEIKNAIKQCLV